MPSQLVGAVNVSFLGKVEANRVWLAQSKDNVILPFDFSITFCSLYSLVDPTKQPTPTVKRVRQRLLLTTATADALVPPTPLQQNPVTRT